jgi:hypothetical protein
MTEPTTEPPGPRRQTFVSVSRNVGGGGGTRTPPAIACKCAMAFQSIEETKRC